MKKNIREWRIVEAAERERVRLSMKKERIWDLRRIKIWNNDYKKNTKKIYKRKKKKRMKEKIPNKEGERK